ncbi:alpha/beta-hydrolase [Xylariaceae sp. FL0594]|nr:alpha/beta-hydrolase [Xylariaceae sp. FL0594]
MAALNGEVRPFTITVSDAELEDLRSRLRNTRYPTELEDAGNDHGAPLEAVRRIATHWGTAYDWRKAESSLNELPHFTTTLQADGFEPLQVHFVHKRSSRPDAVPLIFVHGWPGSFLEVTKLLGPLTEPEDASAQAFHVVAPSLLGYGFSEGSRKRGFGADQHAETFHKLMLRLGYDEYATQGGDWGFFITRAMARRYAPAHVKAQHLNLDWFPRPSIGRNPLTLLKTAFAHATGTWSERDKKGLERSKWFQEEGSGYNQVQGTRPQTIGYALADSPVALLAWIYEKLVDWTDAYPWTDDEVCTWVSIYWFSTAGPRAAHQLYYEAYHATKGPEYEDKKRRGLYVSSFDDIGAWIDVKLGFGHFPRDVIVLPKEWGRVMGRVVFEREHERGGHFAAWEVPDLLVRDLRDMFGVGGGAHGAVKTVSS